MGEIVREPFPVPIGFIAGTDSAELRQAGMKATRKLVGENIVTIEGTHLFPMEKPQETVDKTRAMIHRLLGR
jgi:surfactin synthase thioesterase subunit